MIKIQTYTPDYIILVKEVANFLADQIYDHQVSGKTLQQNIADFIAKKDINPELKALLLSQVAFLVLAIEICYETNETKAFVLDTIEAFITEKMTIFN